MPLMTVVMYVFFASLIWACGRVLSQIGKLVHDIHEQQTVMLHLLEGPNLAKAQNLAK